MDQRAMMNALCANCRQPTLPNAVFCHHCGTQIQKRCPSCTTPNPAASAFCHNCGTKLESPSPETGAAPPAGAPAIPRPEAIAFCPRCQASNDFQSRFCYRCGLPLERAGSGGATAPVAAPQELLGPKGESIGVPAGFWVRLAAFVIDSLLITIASRAIMAGVGIDIERSTLPFEELIRMNPLRLFKELVITPETLIGNAIEGVYLIVGWSVWGTSIGKRVFNLYVTRPDGSRLGPWRALARYLSYWLSAFIFLVGYLMVAFRKDKRALHDLIVDSHVVIKKR